MIDAWKWNSLAKIVYTDNIRVFFQKNVFNPHVKSVLSIFFCSKIHWYDFFKNTAQLRATRRNLGIFRFFFITKLHSYIAFFSKKKKQKKWYWWEKSRKKIVNANLHRYIDLFLPQTTASKPHSISDFLYFFSKIVRYIDHFFTKILFLCYENKGKIRFFPFFF